ncbi:MAG: bifunctional phosphopantothenoylcysteine decarboxylase/phosphopantothenate--cysteine ligase CoaBC [Chloroflexota bacterium]
MGHLELARWAQVLVVAPASAGAIARLALGTTDDLLAATALACTAPVVLAPAMESAMFRHPATQLHLETMRSRGAAFAGPVDGRLASGAIGPGRMAEPAEIVAAIENVLMPKRDLTGKRVLVTAGPTYESIDPVRFLGNRSSGKMGFALAGEATRRGADVMLIAGPTSLSAPPGVRLERIESAAEMRAAVLDRVAGQDVVVMAAAVADFRPSEARSEKLKRGDGLVLHLVPTADIAAEAAALEPGALHVGFALETGNLVAAAREKMVRKKQDLVVANAISAEHNPFDSDSNRVTLVTGDSVQELPLLAKQEVAARIWDTVALLLLDRAAT